MIEPFGCAPIPTFHPISFPAQVGTISYVPTFASFITPEVKYHFLLQWQSVLQL
jgi:hypothetical protein